MRPERAVAASVRRDTQSARLPRGLGMMFLMFVCACVAVGGVRAQDAPAAPAAGAPAAAVPARLSISLLTIGPGEIYFERFGHNAILVRDDASGEAIAYNYGMFDFAQENFLLNFVRGHMRYRIAANPLADDLAQYRAEGRSVVEQELRFTPAQALALARFLEWNARPENAWYRYDYFTANCSTRVRDALDHALGGLIHAQSVGRSRGYSYRIDALRLMAPDPALMLLIDLGLGPFSDQRIDFWDESFVPMTLQGVVERVRLADGQPLVGARRVLAESRIPEPPALPRDLRWPFLILGLALAAALVWLGGRGGRGARITLAAFATVFELSCGIGGVLLLFLWLGTDHIAAWRNENLALLDPLCLLLLPTWIGALRRPWRPGAWTLGLAWLVVLIAGLALASKILPWFAQANEHWIFLLLPVHVALAIGLLQARTMQARAR